MTTEHGQPVVPDHLKAALQREQSHLHRLLRRERNTLLARINKDAAVIARERRQQMMKGRP